MAEAILVADDEAGVRESLAEVLRDAGYTVETAVDGSAALAALDAHDFAVVITDLRMPGADGLAVLRKLREVAPQTVPLVMTAHGSVESAVEALRAGAADYILKPVVFDDVLAKVARVLEHRQLAWQTQMLRREIEREFDFDHLVGKSAAMQEVFHLSRKVAPTETTVLITGESGTGKEVVARAIHHYSQAAGKVFLPVNCAAIEGKEILPVGSTQPITIEVRIVTATNRDLKQMVQQGTFREDLYYRLNVMEIHLPPLRDRREDIPELVEFLVRRHNREMKRSYRGVDNATMKLLMSQPWKGNVRELDNVIEHAMILGDGDWITVADLPRALREDETALPPVGDELRDALRAYEKIHIETVLRRLGNDKRQAADALGLSLSSLYRKMNELGIPLV